MTLGRSISNDEIIQFAACPTCCSFRKEPCNFNRTEDPEGVRRYRRQSHDQRVIRAKEIFAKIHAMPLDI